MEKKQAVKATEPPATPVDVMSLSMRPRTLSALVGQESTVKAIRAQMAKRPPRTWLFTGPPGCGKTTLAWVMATALQCDHMQQWGDPCQECWRRRLDFSVHEINASEASGVAELEEVARLSMSRPMSGHRRVIILDEVQNISKQGWSMLLKPMEKPPATTVWILCTSEDAKVPAANARRCTIYKMRPLGIDASEAFIKRAASRIGCVRPLAPLFDALHTMHVGSPGVMLQALEKYAAGTSAPDAVAGVDGGEVDTLALCKAVTSGDWGKARVHLDPKDATPDKSRWIRASVSGWLRGCMLRADRVSEAERHAASLLELSNPPFDEALLHQWLAATICRITGRYAKG